MQTVLQETLASGFLASIRQAMPDTSVVREALSFIRLIIDHPSPPREFAALHRTLWDIINVDAGDRFRAAERTRRAAHQALRLTNHSTSGQVLELALLVLALQFDDRPAQRMLCVDIGMMAAGIEVVGGEDMVPAWKADGSPTSLMSSGLVRPWIQSHVAAVCQHTVQEMDKASNAFARWNSEDCQCALLGMRMSYCIFRTDLDGLPCDTYALLQHFDEVGLEVWNGLAVALRDKDDLTRMPRSMVSRSWHEQARNLVRKAIAREEVRTMAPSPASPPAADSSGAPEVKTKAQLKPKPPETAPAAPVPQYVDGPALTICRSPIADAIDKYDREEIARHRILESPLPLVPMPHPEDVQWMRDQLGEEFPWAQGVLDAVFGDLLGRARLGVQALAMPPTLLVGSAGSGKSRLARRIADELKVPRIDLALGGTSDSKVLSGTSRGWGSAKPNDLATLMATRRSATAIVLLDEIDKSFDGREGSGIQSYLLGLLEPETARRHTDVFLKTECDFSAVMWIATANRLSTVQRPLLSRLRVLMLGQPAREHYPVIAENVLGEIANSWGMEREVLPSLDELAVPWDQLATARQVRLAMEGAVMEWARQVRKH